VSGVTRFPQAALGTRQRVPQTMRDAARPSGPVDGRVDVGASAFDVGGPAGRNGRVGAELRRMLTAGELDLPLPGAGRTGDRWAALSAWGARDLSLARLAEGHVDALAILAEAGREPVQGALYGVWASRSGGASVRLERRGDTAELRGTMRFCSGARVLDRALVVVDPPPGVPPERLLLDVDVRGHGVEPVPGTWCTAAMAEADTLDVVFDGVGVGVRRGGPGRLDSDPDGGLGALHTVGEPGWYVARRGFALGGAGVAAVWWGGAAGVLDRVLPHLGGVPDRHALAHVGELHAALAAVHALLQRTAALVDTALVDTALVDTALVDTALVDTAPVDTAPANAGAPTGTGSSTGTATVTPPDLALAVATLRAAAERAVREVVDRAPRIVGPGPLSRDADLAGALADLALYVRQHHAERDHAALGEQVVDRWRTA
jgi:hypothetical protein